MSHPLQLKQRAILLRKNGFSLKEISETLSISKSTASLWLSRMTLSAQAEQKLKQKQILGQYKTVLLKRKYREDQAGLALLAARNDLETIQLSQELWKLCCCLLWWCEGNKDSKVVRFTSSDPTLIQNFLLSFRSGFKIDESKFRALVHLHSYHNDELQKEYWSQITKIPLNQFYASFQKQNTGIRTKENYPGCVAISYYDAKIAKELAALYNAFTLYRGIR